MAIGVLRGGLADDGAWRANPAPHTVIVGTVDMVGSRLLFAGYGDGRSRRALHAGLLGHDTLVLLDEAHLALAMASLLGAVAALQRKSEFHVIALPAISARSGAVHGPRPELSCSRRLPLQTLAPRTHDRRGGRVRRAVQPDVRARALRRQTATCGENTVLRRAAPVASAERRPRHGDLR